MPAIDPARLRQQAALLADSFDRPEAFVRSLHHLLDFYADRAHRRGQVGEPAPLLEAYNVRPPVLRQVLLELSPLAAQDAPTALALCDALWDEGYLEFRMLAVFLLGEIPPQPPESILVRALAWARSQSGKRIVSLVLDQGLAGLRRQDPDGMFRLLEGWLTDGEGDQASLAMQALLPVIADPQFENLPVIFRLLFSMARQAPPALRPDLLDVLAALARRSPQETAYFLRQCLETSLSPDIPWLIRQSLDAFPPEVQEYLRAALRQTSEDRR